MQILNPNITNNELIIALSNSLDNLMLVREEAALPKQVVIEFVECFKSEAQLVKDMLVRNYEKAEVDKLILNADELIEKIRQDPNYILDNVDENLRFREQFFSLGLEKQK